MWLRSQDLKKINDHIALYGKSLILSQKYEMTCKDIIKMLNIAYSLGNQEYEFLSSEYMTYVDKLKSMLLGNALRNIEGKKKIFGISTDEMKILDKAREARNWIIHESGEEIFQKQYTRESSIHVDEQFLSIFRSHIIDLSRGDFLVSKWSYEFYEKENYNYIGQERYIEMITKWIFEGYLDEEEYFA